MPADIHGTNRGKIAEGAEIADINAIREQMLRVDVGSADDISPNETWTGKHLFYCGDNYGGFPLHSFNKDAYLDVSDSHTLIIGATGSMKTRRLISPGIRMLTRAGESMIIADPKAELYNRCSPLMIEKGYKIYVLNFRNPASGDCWNPLALPFMFMKENDMSRCSEAVFDLATSLIPNENKGDPYWNDTARNLFFGLCMLLIEKGRDVEGDELINIANVLRLRRDLSKKNDLEYILKCIEKWPVISSSVVGAFTAPWEKTRSSIYSVFDQYLRVFMLSSDLMQMVSKQSIDFKGFDNDDKIAIFLIMPDEKTTYHKLISLFIKQSYEYLIFAAQRKNGAFNRRINYVLDEFSTLPKINDFPGIITASRSRRIRFYLAIQSNYQLRARYDGEAQTIKANCNNWIFLTSKELEILNELSDLGGQMSSGRRLLPIHKLQQLSKDRGEALLLLGRNKPLYTELLDIEKFDGLSSPEQIILKDREPFEINTCDVLDWLTLASEKKADIFDW